MALVREPVKHKDKGFSVPELIWSLHGVGVLMTLPEAKCLLPRGPRFLGGN